jgi:sugar transferase (PEP-CTERM system associated)
MHTPAFQDLSSGIKSLLIIEFLIFSGALLLAINANNYLYFVEVNVIPSDILVVFTLIFALVVQLSSLSLGLYNSKLRESFRGIIHRLLLAITIGFSITSLLNSLYSEQPIVLEVLVVSAVFSFFLAGFFRYLTLQIDFFGFNKRNVLVLGAGERSSIIEKKMRRGVDRQRFFVHGFVIMQGDSDNSIVNEKQITLTQSLVSYARENNINEIVVANDERRKTLPIDELFACKIRGIEITEILDFIERETGQIAVDLIYPSWIIYSNGFESANYLRNALDWVFNAVMAFVLFMLTWPIMLVTALLIKLDEGLTAPVFYTQQRIGLDGEPFNIIKFRSMRLDAEKNGAQMASVNDNRITTIGHVLRKYRIDELPQIYNVIRGHMGFVGPRPERPEFVQQLIKLIPYFNERHNVKPGLTGWAQLRYHYGATKADSLEKLKYDLYYIKHRSFGLDILILIRTVEIVLFGKGR